MVVTSAPPSSQAEQRNTVVHSAFLLHEPVEEKFGSSRGGIRERRVSPGSLGATIRMVSSSGQNTTCRRRAPWRSAWLEVIAFADEDGRFSADTEMLSHLRMPGLGSC